MIDITSIVNAVIALLAAVVSTFLVPWIKGKVEAQKLEKVADWVTIAVSAAEQIYKESGMGEKKKQYVLDFLDGKGLTVDINSVDAMIEAAVYGLKEK